MCSRTALPNYRILPGDPTAAPVRALIAELDAIGSALYPAESNHFDAPETLVAVGALFLVVDIDGVLVGCGAAKNCGGWAEIKRMYLKPEARGLGIAPALLQRLLDWTRAQGLPAARLEVGVASHAALAAYRRAGFTEIDAFPPYRADPMSVFMECPVG